MKNKLQMLLMALMTFGAIHHAAAQGTAFTYQGRLNDSGQCANGQFDLQFQLYASAIGGAPLYASTTITSDVSVTNGLFTVTLDFGPGVFTGATYFLETDVRTNSPGSGLPYTALAPRLQVLPVPYAVYAQTAGMAATASNFSGSVGGNISGTQGSLVVTTVGGQTAASIAQGVVAANNATPSSVPNSIVKRDTNGNFSANALTLSAALNLPYPAILSSGGTNFLVEEGSLFIGLEKTPIVPQPNLDNTGVGDYALGASATTGGVSGNDNTAVGEYALNANTSGGYNTAVGLDALQDNNGFNNTAVGWSALQANTIGHANTATGFRALYLNTNGSDNVAMGYDALETTVSGIANTALGVSALAANTNGSLNTAVGFGVLFQNFNGNNNTGVGYDAMAFTTNEGNLVAVGYEALANDNAANPTNTASQTGENTAIGYQALTENTTGFDNTAVGYLALQSNKVTAFNTAVGASALSGNLTGGGNTASGAFVLASNTAGFNNTANGFQALLNNTMGYYNTAIGSSALVENTNGYYNMAAGSLALQQNTSGAYNTASGALALFNNINGAYNTATGFEALYANTNGYWNVADGYQSLYNNTSGYSNTANGASALFANTTGAYNTGTGAGTLSANTTGWFNTASGYNALLENSSGFYNTAEGAFALHSSTGSYNIALGISAGANLITGSSNIYIGNPGLDGDNHAIRIGDVTDTNITVTVIAGIFNGTLGSAGTEVMVDATGHLGVRVSSAKFKHDIQPMGDVSDVLLKLKPVTFKYNADRDPNGTPEFGLVAEQVNEVDPDLVVRDGNHQVYSVRYEAVNAMLLNEFLKQHQTVEEQSATIADLKARLDRMEQMMSKHE